MRRLLPALLLILLPCTLAVATPSKEFKEYGFKWTLPSSDWAFVPTSSGEKDAGFVAKAECSAASIEVWAYVKGAEGLSLDERIDELKQQGGEGLGEPTRTKVLDTTVSGVKGKVVVMKIQAEGGAEGHFRKYAILSRGKFYQLLFRCWHGAHLSMSDEVNGVRQGFRLLKGAGDEDEAEEMDEVEGGGSNGGGKLPEGHPPVDRGDEDGGMLGGVERDGRTVKIHKRNIEWTLPEKSPLAWKGATEDAEQESGRFVWAEGRVQREKKEEYEKDTPDFNACRLELLIQPARPGTNPLQWMKSGQAQKQVVEDWKFLDEVYSAKSRTKDEVKLGNHTGSFTKLEGKFRGGHRVIMLFATVLKGDWYVIRAILQGHTDAYKMLAPHVGKALSGIRFLETKEAARGPLLGVFPSATQKRGKFQGVEKRITGPGYVFMKPKELARLEVKGDATREIKLVCEGRSEDGEAYLYFEVRFFQLNVSNRPNPDPEKFIDKRAQDWLAGAGEGASLGGKKGLKIKPGRFGTAKGDTYEFTGTLDDTPFVERGWIVKHKSVMLWIKMQFGGEDAPAKLKKLSKAIVKAFKYKK